MNTTACSQRPSISFVDAAAQVQPRQQIGPRLESKLSVLGGLACCFRAVRVRRSSCESGSKASKFGDRPCCSSGEQTLFNDTAVTRSLVLHLSRDIEHDVWRQLLWHLLFCDEDFANEFRFRACESNSERKQAEKFNCEGQLSSLPPCMDDQLLIMEI